ncbi:multicopper oxidase family protein [Castellaniella sp.]|uniref:multicopper oxidase family protein n=1 Tax=Castellaniella sp. TaxID=1955812 RepID=UPI003A923487
MTTHHFITRRTFLGYAGTSAAALLAGLPPVEATPVTKAGDNAFEPDIALELTAQPQSVALRSGPATPVWTYQARVVKGDPASVHASPGGYLGPTLRVRRGQKLRVDFVNHTDQPSIVNWHGLHVPADMMGLPRYEVKPGEHYRYEFEVRDRAGTYWYHAMAAGHTPEQVYFGLAGLLLVTDDEEQALALPRGEYDVPLVIQDRTFGDNNHLHYLPGTGPEAAPTHGSSPQAPGMGSGVMGGSGMMGGQGMMSGNGTSDGMTGGGMMGGMMGGQGMMSGGMSGMMTRMMGFFGDTILVNGKPDATLKVATHAYRLRVLNASNARTYKLGWEDGRPLTVIATGGGLLERPVQKDYVMLTPGQRIELWADFSQDAVGTQLALMSLAFDGMSGMMESTMGEGMMGGGMMGNMMSRMMSGSSLADGARFVILKVAVTQKADEVLELPQHLSTLTRLRAEDAVNRDRPRIFRVTMGHMRWGFNGRSFQMNEVTPDEIVKLGTTEVWEFVNNMMMAHAIHLHGLQFQVLERRNSPQGVGVVEGCVDDGWEDTVLLMPNERVKLLMRFADFTGSYAYQCHMLEHAAMGLMRDYEVQPAQTPA